jgi:hypothetical protein
MRVNLAFESCVIETPEPLSCSTVVSFHLQAGRCIISVSRSQSQQLVIHTLCDASKTFQLSSLAQKASTISEMQKFSSRCSAKERSGMTTNHTSTKPSSSSSYGVESTALSSVCFVAHRPYAPRLEKPRRRVRFYASLQS